MSFLDAPEQTLYKHETTVSLDHQAGGWLASCSCGWTAKRPCWYKVRAQGFAARHLSPDREPGTDAS